MSQSYFKLIRSLTGHEHQQWCLPAVERGLRTPQRRSSRSQLA
nr:MAG TPA: hypothetical protein [Caudoviricetes sp.]